jgi:hypothetical protein
MDRRGSTPVVPRCSISPTRLNCGIRACRQPSMIPTIQRTTFDYLVGPLVMSFNHSFRQNEVFDHSSDGS